MVESARQNLGIGQVRLWHLCTLGGQSARHYVPEEQHVLSVCDHAGGAAKMQCTPMRWSSSTGTGKSGTLDHMCPCLALAIRTRQMQYTPPPTGAAYSAGAVATHDSASLARRSRPLFLQELVRCTPPPLCCEHGKGWCDELHNWRTCCGHYMSRCGVLHHKRWRCDHSMSWCNAFHHGCPYCDVMHSTLGAGATITAKAGTAQVL